MMLSGTPDDVLRLEQFKRRLARSIDSRETAQTDEELFDQMETAVDALLRYRAHWTEYMRSTGNGHPMR